LIREQRNPKERSDIRDGTNVGPASRFAHAGYLLKPGHDAYLIPSPRFGRDMRFRNLSDVRSTCEIQ
jgi:hypothetical protein